MIGRDHDRDDVRTFRLDRVRGDVRFATRRERDFRVPPEFDPSAYRNRAPWQLGEGEELATILVEPEAAWLVERAVGQYGTMEHRDDRSLLYTTAVADWQELAGWLIGLDGLATPLSPPELVERVASALERVAADARGRAAAARRAARARRPRARRPSAASRRSRRSASRCCRRCSPTCSRPAASARTRCIDAAELAERFKLTDDELEDHLQLLNLVNFGGGCYAVYAERVDDGRTIHVEKELYGDEFRRPARLSPLEAKALLLALDLVGPLVAADAGTTLDDVRAKLEAAFGRYDMRGAPRRSRRRSTRTCCRCSRRPCAAASWWRSSTSARQADAVERRVVEPHYLRGVRGDWYCDTWDRTRDGERTFRVDRIREARALGETFERRASVTARVDGALGDHAGTASVWFSSRQSRAGELEGHTDAVPAWSPSAPSTRAVTLSRRSNDVPSARASRMRSTRNVRSPSRVRSHVSQYQSPRTPRR